MPYKLDKRAGLNRECQYFAKKMKARRKKELLSEFILRCSG